MSRLEEKEYFEMWMSLDHGTRHKGNAVALGFTTHP